MTDCPASSCRWCRRGRPARPARTRSPGHPTPSACRTRGSIEAACARRRHRADSAGRDEGCGTAADQASSHSHVCFSLPRPGRRCGPVHRLNVRPARFPAPGRAPAAARYARPGHGREAMERPERGFATRAIHVGQGPDPATGAVVQPIHLATTFAQEGIGRHGGYEYARSNNPTREQLETCLASLESGRHGLAFASGLAATTTVLLLLDPGDHVVYMQDAYGGTYRLFDKVMRRYGVTFTAVDATVPGAIESAMTERTRLVWIETPTNPLLRIVDIAAAATRSRTRAERRWRSTAPSRHRTRSGRSSSARTSSCTAPRSTSAATATCSAAAWSRATTSSRSDLRFHQNAVGRRAVPLRLLAAAARTEDPRAARPAAQRQRAGGGPPPRGPPGGASRSPPRPALAPAARARHPPDERRLRRHGVLRARRRGGGRARARGAPPLHPGRVAGRGGVARRAPRAS